MYYITFGQWVILEASPISSSTSYVYLFYFSCNLKKKYFTTSVYKSFFIKQSCWITKSLGYLIVIILTITGDIQVLISEMTLLSS